MSLALSWKDAKRILTRWRWYGCSLLVRFSFTCSFITEVVTVRHIWGNGELWIEQSYGPVA